MKIPAPNPTISTAPLGPRLRRLRRESGLTLEQLAERSGVSRAMLSHVERGEKSPTLPLVVRIASAFGLSLTSLLEEPTPAEGVILRAPQRPVFTDPVTGFERIVLAPQPPSGGVELVEHRLPPGQGTGDLPPYADPTDKVVTVLTGRLIVEIEDASHTLGPGDTLRFQVRSVYRFRNPDSRRRCVYLMVIARRR